MSEILLQEAIRLACTCFKNGVHERYIRLALINDGADPKHLDSIILWAKRRAHREMNGE